MVIFFLSSPGSTNWHSWVTCCVTEPGCETYEGRIPLLRQAGSPSACQRCLFALMKPENAGLLNDKTVSVNQKTGWNSLSTPSWVYTVCLKPKSLEALRSDSRLCGWVNSAVEWVEQILLVLWPDSSALSLLFVYASGFGMMCLQWPGLWLLFSVTVLTDEWGSASGWMTVRWS